MEMRRHGLLVTQKQEELCAQPPLPNYLATTTLNGARAREDSRAADSSLPLFSRRRMISLILMILNDEHRIRLG